MATRGLNEFGLEEGHFAGCCDQGCEHLVSV